jgi:NADH:ubiquinone oxidoreductase subunit 6 (subunit J)
MNERNYTLKNWMGVGLIVVGALLLLFAPAYSMLGSILLNVGAVLIFIIFVRRRWRKEPDIQDERTKKIGAVGLSWSWLMTLMLMCVLYLLTIGQVINPDPALLLAGLMLFTGVSGRLLQVYFYRKGDIGY